MPYVPEPFSGAKLKAFREDSGLTRDELGAAAGRSPFTILGYESGRFQIPLTVAYALAAVLGLELDDLRADPPKPERKSRRAAKAR